MIHPGKRQRQSRQIHELLDQRFVLSDRKIGFHDVNKILIGKNGNAGRHIILRDGEGRGSQPADRLNGSAALCLRCSQDVEGCRSPARTDIDDDDSGRVGVRELATQALRRPERFRRPNTAYVGPHYRRDGVA